MALVEKYSQSSRLSTFKTANWRKEPLDEKDTAAVISFQKFAKRNLGYIASFPSSTMPLGIFVAITVQLFLCDEELDALHIHFLVPMTGEVCCLKA